MAATLEIPEPLFERLARLAQRRGQTTEELVTEILAERAESEGQEHSNRLLRSTPTCGAPPAIEAHVSTGRAWTRCDGIGWPWACRWGGPWWKPSPVKASTSSWSRWSH